MTTKVLRHPINPLTLLPFHQKPASLLQPSMDRKLESRNVEAMRKMMVMQEQVFKHQVEELHRLYNLQKKLMNEMENGLKTRKQITAFTERTINSVARDDHREASGSSSVESSKMLINFDLKSTTSNIHHFAEQKASIRIEDEADMEVDLTLSIGHSMRKQRSNLTQEIGSSSGKEDSSHQENMRPRWLMQDLSLNRS